MREFARFVAIGTLGLGILVGFVLCLMGLSSLDSYRGGLGWMGVGLGVGTFLSSAVSACVLYLLVNIDERLEAAGWRARSKIGTPEEAEAASRADALLGPRSSS